jgi:peptidoglycan/xylan/chitin deacetylase (PgdA/CDA1 family)
MFKKVFLVIFIIIAAVIFYMFGFSHPSDKATKGYKNLVDYHAENDASEEISAAKVKYDNLPPNFEAAKVIIGDSNAKNREIAITCDGMADRGVMEGLLEIFKKNDMKVTFFLEGLNAELDPKLVATIAKSGNSIGNYSYVGITHGEQLPTDKLFEEICHSEKALKNISGTSPNMLKLDATIYNTTIARCTKVCGINYLVKSSTFLPIEKITNIEEAQNFVTKIKPGMIVSIKLGIPVGVQAEKSKVDDVPAIDKQPGIKFGLDPVEKPNVIEAVTLFCKALKDEGYTTVTVSDFSKYAQDAL